MDEKFKCKVCLGIVIEPKKCSNQNCAIIFCNNCREGNQCPKRCLAAETKKRKYQVIEYLDFVYKTELHNLTLECESCSKEFNYKEMLKHLADCNQQEFDCPLNCGHQQQIKGEINLRYHLTYVCPNAIYTCKDCNTVATKEDLIEHNCIESLIREVDRQKGMVSEKDRELALERDRYS